MDARFAEYDPMLARMVWAFKRRRQTFVALDDDCTGDEDVVLQATLTRTDMARLYASLDGREQALVRMKVSGASNREAARAMGLTDVQVCRALKRIKRHLRA